MHTLKGVSLEAKLNDNIVKRVSVVGLYCNCRSMRSVMLIPSRYFTHREEISVKFTVQKKVNIIRLYYLLYSLNLLDYYLNQQQRFLWVVWYQGVLNSTPWYSGSVLNS